MSNTRELQILINAKDNASKTLSGVSSSVKSLAQDATIGAGIITGAFALTAKSAINVASNYEQTRVAFETMLGSGERAGKLLKDLSAFARKTPFDLPQVTEGAKQLLAYGFTQDKIIDTTRRLGDISSGLKIPLGDMVYLYGTLRAQGRAYTKDLNQFMNRGIPVIELLAKKFKVTSEEIYAMTEAGEIGFKDIEGIFKDMTSEGGQFFNMMSEQSKTFGGIMSNIRDNVVRFTLALMGIGEDGEIRKGSFFFYLKQGAEELQRQLDILQPRFEAFVKYLMGNKEILFAFFAGLTGLIITLGVQFAIMLAPALLVAGAFALIGIGIAGFIEANGGLQQTIEDLKTKWEDLRVTLQRTKDNLEIVGRVILDFLDPSIQGLKKALQDLWLELEKTGITSNDVKGFMSALGSVIRFVVMVAVTLLTVALRILIEAVKIIAEKIKGAIEIFNSFKDALFNSENKVQALAGAVSKLIEKLTGLEKMRTITIDIIQRFTTKGKKESKQHGGFIDAPYHQEVPAILHGGERVIPRMGTDVNKSGGGAISLNINFSGPVSMDSEARVDELAKQVVRLMGRQSELASLGLAI